MLVFKQVLKNEFSILADILEQYRKGQIKCIY